MQNWFMQLLGLYHWFTKWCHIIHSETTNIKTYVFSIPALKFGSRVLVAPTDTGNYIYIYIYIYSNQTVEMNQTYGNIKI